ncbi:hypothetical protein ACCC88_12220 [Sphingomonas sp. Sphisp140]|uniref:hypothetical protein n=1 Tax=unclassified Sphingomonas TaxID=196159 RepID=UPI0039AEFB77
MLWCLRAHLGTLVAPALDWIGRWDIEPARSEKRGHLGADFSFDFGQGRRVRSQRKIIDDIGAKLFDYAGVCSKLIKLH